MRLFFFILWIFVISIMNSQADMRSYVWTYEYMIMDPGKAEIEHYLTISAPKISEIKGNAFVEHKLEIEIGMTNHFDFSIYQNFVQAKDKTFQYTGFDLRARFLIGQKNQFLLDPLIYLEYGANTTLAEHKFEGKIILAKDIGKLNFAINPIFEIEYEDEIEYSVSYAIGCRYEFSPLFRSGIEFKGSKDCHYIGIVFSHGKEKLWVAASPTIMFTSNPKNKPEFLFRMILGLGI
ncbi:MAG: hypothetical protein N2560_01700 [Ignavibacteria bacterium]|nr:hypothetical protein [Ignavibacteria bacterium]